MESDDYVKRYVGERSEEVILTNGAGYNANIRLTCKIAVVGQAHRLPGIRTWKARDRCVRRPFLFRELQAGDRDSVPHCCQSQRGELDERSRLLLSLVSQPWLLMWLQVSQHRIFPACLARSEHVR